MEIKKFHKLACNLYNKEKYVVHFKAFKQALNHRLIFKKYIKQSNLIKKHGRRHTLTLIQNPKMIFKKTFSS